MRGMNAWVCVGTDNKREFVAVSVGYQANQTAALVMIVTTSHVTILLVTHVPIGQDGPNGDNVPPHAALVSVENKELAMEKILKKVKISVMYRVLKFLIFFLIFWGTKILKLLISDFRS